MIAALYVATGGIYFGRAEVDPWDVERDARTYAGPHRVIAHPPCERWGRYAGGGPNPHAARRQVGDDGGCFAAALASVRRWGGVLEHPAATKAWSAHGLRTPPMRGGWIVDAGGWSCHVEQGHYGHRARKATWLHCVGVPPPSLTWGRSSSCRMDAGYHSRAERQRGARSVDDALERMSKRERTATPGPFADLLIFIARGAL